MLQEIGSLEVGDEQREINTDDCILPIGHEGGERQGALHHQLRHQQDSSHQGTQELLERLGAESDQEGGRHRCGGREEDDSTDGGLQDQPAQGGGEAVGAQHIRRGIYQQEERGEHDSTGHCCGQ